MIKLFSHRNRNDAIAFWRGRMITISEFIGHAQVLAKELPEGFTAINLCQDRYKFLVSFVAALLRGQINLLPPSLAVGSITAVARDLKKTYCIIDSDTKVNLPSFRPRIEKLGTTAVEDLEIPVGQIAAYVFTSGSTGRPCRHEKRLPLVMSANTLLVRRLSVLNEPLTNLVATVPSQHMFGLELTVLLPMTGVVCVHAAKPFFPADINQALQEVPAPRMLVSTPVHLAAIAQSTENWPALTCIVSSTGVLDQTLAGELEEKLACPVIEIYGSTETGAIATRRPTVEDTWQLLDDMHLEMVTGGTQLHGPQFATPFAMQDKLELLDKQYFRLLGRPNDLIKVAGKRGSLADINIKLNAVAGVEDGVILVPEDMAHEHRLQAVVVAPATSDEAIRAALLKELDPVFVPREFIRVEKLPRDELGKIARDALQLIVSTADKSDA